MVASNIWHSSQTKKVASLSAYDKAQVLKVLKKTNEYRQAVGKPPLEWDEKLAAYAQMRSQEIAEKYNPPHKRPDGKDWSSEIIMTYGAIGENIAAGQGNAEEVSLGWKNSPGHYRNMISGNFSRIGIGLVRVPNASDPQGYTYYWTQTFGGGNAKSPYTFDENRKPKEPDVINILGNNIVLLEENKLDIQGGEEVASNASIAYKRGQLRHPAYSKSLKFSYDGFDAIVQDPKATGFEYQTFGEIVDGNQFPVQYINIGKATTPDDISIVRATYKGVALGSVKQHKHYYSDVTADIADKNMHIVFSNTRFNDQGDDVAFFSPNTPQGRGLNFSENMQWDSQKHRFVKEDTQGNHIHAHFYGPNGEEIGGQFDRDVTDLGRYRGAFGAKKQ
ncbi:CAP domain-containing protein [Pasteurella atlantica]|nr:CAP domain-containing protein [Pasteurella atlantica]MDP8046246.1 CAP domain-containing protein [Pasteurella atlantica]MDP8160758.1 CAP domain-containing protein [Pasteurella atlantica]